MNARGLHFKKVLESAAHEAGIVVWGMGNPRDYERLAGSSCPSLEAVAGFKPTLLIGFGEPYALEGLEALEPASIDHSTQPLGRVSPMAWGHDYHQTLHHKAQLWLEVLNQSFSGLTSKVCVDTTPLVDRAAAEVCGLGHRGRNGFLINPQLGTAWNIGVILIGGISIDDVVEPEELRTGIQSDSTAYFQCQSCRACKAVCPTAAIQEEGGIVVNKCLSAVTQRKGALTEIEMTTMGNRLYGCDLCQTVCPANRHRADFVKAPRINLFELLAMTKSTYKEAYQHTGFYWRGLGLMKRNALVALGNLEDTKRELTTVEGRDENVMLYRDGNVYTLNSALLPLVERWLVKK